MRCRPLCFVALLVLVTAVGACRDSGTPDVSRTDKGVLRLGRIQAVDTVARAVAPNGRPLVLEGMRGSVHLAGAAQSTADLSFIRRGRGKSAEAARSVLNGIRVTERGTEAKYTYTLAADRKTDYAAVDVQGQVPRGGSLRIDRLTGPVRISGVRGPVTIKHEHGSVEVRGAAAPVQINIENGDVHVGFRTVPDDGDVQLQTSNGDIRLEVPPDAAAQIEAQTDAGVIRTRGASFTDEQLAPMNAGAHYVAQMGTGGSTIALQTQNGSISIQARVSTEPADTTEGDTTTVPPPEPATVPATDTTVAPHSDPDTTGIDTAAVDTTTPDTDRF